MKDRAKPFDRKHRRYWIPTVGGMALIMAINLALGFGVMQCKAAPPPTPDYHEIPPMIDPPDAGVAVPPDALRPDGSLPDDVER